MSLNLNKSSVKVPLLKFMLFEFIFRVLQIIRLPSENGSSLSSSINSVEGEPWWI